MSTTTHTRLGRRTLTRRRHTGPTTLSPTTLSPGAPTVTKAPEPRPSSPRGSDVQRDKITTTRLKVRLARHDGYTGAHMRLYRDAVAAEEALRGAVAAYQYAASHDREDHHPARERAVEARARFIAAASAFLDAVGPMPR